MPCILAFGNCGRSPDSNRLANKSPDVSPATIAIDTLADDATGRTAEKLAHHSQIICRVRRIRFCLQQCDLCLVERQTRLVDQLVRISNIADLFACESAALKALDIDSMRLGRVTRQLDERRHILRQAGVHSDEGMRADFAELMDCGKAADDYPVADMNMTTQRRVIGKNRVISDLAVVRQVNVCKDPVIVAEPSNTGILRGTQIEGAEFANQVSVTDFQPGLLSAIFFVLGGSADRRKRREGIVTTNCRMPVDHHMWSDLGSSADLYVRPDNRVSANLD